MSKLSRLRTVATLAGLTVALTTRPMAAGPPAAATNNASQHAVGAGYDRAGLQKDLDAIHAAGITGVQAEVHTSTGGFFARSGVAQVGRPDPVPNGAHFRIASNTKTFIATVLLQLVGEGRLKLTDTVEQWLPGVVKGNGYDGRKVTVRQMLQHTSGIYNYTNDLPVRTGYLLDVVVNGVTKELFNRQRHLTYTPEQLVRIAMRHKRSFQPGKGWEYSNTNYVLAGMIISKLTGRDWRREVSDRILKPLGMTHTLAPGRRETLPKPHANGYVKLLGVPGEPWIDATEQNMSFAPAPGELISTTADLHRFFEGLLGGKLLKPAQLNEMRTTVKANIAGHRFRYGLGIMQGQTSCGTTWWHHDGTQAGWLTFNGFSPDGRRGIVISVSATPPVLTPAANLLKAVDNTINHTLCHTH